MRVLIFGLLVLMATPAYALSSGDFDYGYSLPKYEYGLPGSTSVTHRSEVGLGADINFDSICDGNIQDFITNSLKGSVGRDLKDKFRTVRTMFSDPTVLLGLMTASYIAPKMQQYVGSLAESLSLDFDFKIKSCQQLIGDSLSHTGAPETRSLGSIAKKMFSAELKVGCGGDYMRGVYDNLKNSGFVSGKNESDEDMLKMSFCMDSAMNVAESAAVSQEFGMSKDYVDFKAGADRDREMRDYYMSSALFGVDFVRLFEDVGGKYKITSGPSGEAARKAAGVGPVTVLSALAFNTGSLGARASKDPAWIFGVNHYGSGEERDEALSSIVDSSGNMTLVADSRLTPRKVLNRVVYLLSAIEDGSSTDASATELSNGMGLYKNWFLSSNGLPKDNMFKLIVDRNLSKKDRVLAALLDMSGFDYFPKKIPTKTITQKLTSRDGSRTETRTFNVGGGYEEISFSSIVFSGFSKASSAMSRRFQDYSRTAFNECFSPLRYSDFTAPPSTLSTYLSLYREGGKISTATASVNTEFNNYNEDSWQADLQNFATAYWIPTASRTALVNTGGLYGTPAPVPSQRAKYFFHFATSPKCLALIALANWERDGVKDSKSLASAVEHSAVKAVKEYFLSTNSILGSQLTTASGASLCDPKWDGPKLYMAVHGSKTDSKAQLARLRLNGSELSSRKDICASLNTQATNAGVIAQVKGIPYASSPREQAKQPVQETPQLTTPPASGK